MSIATVSPRSSPSIACSQSKPVEAALRLEGVSKTYGSGPNIVHALREVDLAVHTGSLNLIAGPSGSGKSTLLSIMGCLMQPTVGQVHVFHETLDGMNESRRAAIRRRHFGFVFQGIHLMPALNGQENVLLAREIKGLPFDDADEARALMARVGVEDLGARLPRDMSGGQRQRIAIARALVGGPNILLADEPTAALDRCNAEATLELLRDLTRRMDVAVIVVSHDRSLFRYADRLLEIEDGRLME